MWHPNLITYIYINEDFLPFKILTSNNIHLKVYYLICCIIVVQSYILYCNNIMHLNKNKLHNNVHIPWIKKNWKNIIYNKFLNYFFRLMNVFLLLFIVCHAYLNSFLFNPMIVTLLFPMYLYYFFTLHIYMDFLPSLHSFVFFFSIILMLFITCFSIHVLSFLGLSLMFTCFFQLPSK